MHPKRAHDLLRTLLLVAGAAWLAPTAVRAQRSAPDWRRLVGCYRIGSAQIALDSLPAVSLMGPVADAHRAWSYPASPEYLYWRSLANDSLMLVRGNGLWGSTYRFAVHGDSLQGWRTTDIDVTPSSPETVPATAVRESCSRTGEADEPPPNADSLHASLAPALASGIARLLDEHFPGQKVGTFGAGHRRDVAGTAA